MNGWYWRDLPILCAAAGFLELDAAHVGQWAISRPLILGPLLGGVCGDFWLGARIGALVELIVAAELPVGSFVPLNGTVAAAAAVLLSRGADAVVPAAAFPAGLVLGEVYRRIEVRTRRGRSVLARQAEEAVGRGKIAPFRRLVALSLGTNALAAAAFLFLAVAGLGPALARGWNIAPEGVQRGVEKAFEVAPWLGLASLLRVFWK